MGKVNLKNGWDRFAGAFGSLVPISHREFLNSEHVVDVASRGMKEITTRIESVFDPLSGKSCVTTIRVLSEFKRVTKHPSALKHRVPTI